MPLPLHPADTWDPHTRTLTQPLGRGLVIRHVFAAETDRAAVRRAVEVVLCDGAGAAEGAGAGGHGPGISTE